MDPDRLCALQVVLDLDDPLGDLLVDSHIVFPVLKVVVSHVSDVLKVMKKGPQNVFIELHERRDFILCHENRIRVSG